MKPSLTSLTSVLYMLVLTDLGDFLIGRNFRNRLFLLSFCMMRTYTYLLEHQHSAELRRDAQQLPD